MFIMPEVCQGVFPPAVGESRFDVRVEMSCSKMAASCEISDPKCKNKGDCAAE